MITLTLVFFRLSLVKDFTMKHIRKYVLGLMLMTLVLVGLQFKGLLGRAGIEKQQIREAATTAICQTFETIAADSSLDLEVQGCANKGDGSFEMVASATHESLADVISGQLKVETEFDLPYELDVQTAQPPASLQTARMIIEPPTLSNVLIADFAGELVTTLMIMAAFGFIYFRVIDTMRKNSPQGIAKVTGQIRLGGYCFNPSNQALTIGDEVKRMTEKESQLLQYLANGSNRLVRRDEILMSLWGENDYFKGRSLDVFIARLRKYLAEDPSVHIETVHGVGFVLHVGR